MDRTKVYVLGVGFEGRQGLPQGAAGLIERAEVLYGGKRLLSLFQDHPADKVAIGGDIQAAIQAVHASVGKKRQVVLASGDPFFFGIAESLVKELGKQAVEVLPNLSSLQLAFARIKESHSDATFVSLHAKGLRELFAAIPHAKKIGILTDPTNTPQRIASELLERIGPRYVAYVFENLGGANERVTFGELHDIASQTFSPLNVVVLLKKEPGPQEVFPITGIPDKAFFQRTPDKGLITKAEVRAVSLAKLCLRETSVVFDIGAGSGSVGLEAARIARKGMVYAIEKHPEDVEHIKKNRLKLAVANLEIVQGVAPEALEDIPEAPDAVFVGGSGGRMKGILEHVAQVLQPFGRVVVNIATLETLAQTLRALKGIGFQAEVTLIQASKSKELLGLTRLVGLNPVFLVVGWRNAVES